MRSSPRLSFASMAILLAGLSASCLFSAPTQDDESSDPGDTATRSDTTVDASSPPPDTGSPSLSLQPASIDDAVWPGQTQLLRAQYDDDGTGRPCGQLNWSSGSTEIVRLIDASSDNDTAIAQALAQGESELSVQCDAQSELSASLDIQVLGPPPELAGPDAPNLDLWLNPATIRTYPDSQAVRRWNDLSTNELHLSGEMSGDRVVSTKPVDGLANPVAHFGNAHSSLRVQPYDSGYTQGTEITAFFVLNSQNTSTTGKLLTGCSAGNGPSNNQIKLDAQNGVLDVHVATSSTNTTSASLEIDSYVSQGQWVAFAVMVRQPQNETDFNWKAQFVPASNPDVLEEQEGSISLDNQTIEFNQLGQFCSESGEIYAGDMAEVMVFETALSDGARDHIFEYLTRRHSELL